ncbi:MAG: rhodanese-like domain-containing protein [Deltaproteobacteria bacterium]|nr:rhodanese-like domain-containing protein [Deltaproteobacteria bacterium]
MMITLRRLTFALATGGFALVACGSSTPSTCQSTAALCADGGGSGRDATSGAADGAGGLRDGAAGDLARRPDGNGGDASASRDGGAYAPESVTAQTLSDWIKARKDLVLVDVREKVEVDAGFIKGALHLAWNSGALKKRWGEVPKGKTVVVYCAAGSRSAPAAAFLVQQGLRPVYDLKGGFNAWKGAGLPVEMP